MPSVYKGKEPYIFVSYSRRDHAVVYPLIEVMQKQGYRVWFDTGLEAGSNYSDIIAEKIDSCHAFLFMTSKNSIESEYCLDEIMYARDTGKPAWKVYLEENVELPRGIKMRTGRFQDILYWKNPAETEFMRVIQEATILNVCRDVNKQPVKPVPTPPKKTAAESRAEKKAEAERKEQERLAKEKYEKEQELKRLKEQAQAPLWKKTTVIWGISQAILCFLLMPVFVRLEFPKFDDWKICFALAIIPWAVVTLLNLIICKKFRPEDAIVEFFVIPLLVFLISLMISVCVTAFNLPWEMNGFLKFLVSLGVHVLPAIVSATIYVFGHAKMLEIDFISVRRAIPGFLYLLGELLLCFVISAVWKGIFHESSSWTEIFLRMIIPHAAIALIVSVPCIVTQRIPFEFTKIKGILLVVSMILSIVVLMVEIPLYTTFEYPIWAVAIAVNIAPTIVAAIIYKIGFALADIL